MSRSEKKRLDNRFPPSLFAIYLGVLLLMYLIFAIISPTFLSYSRIMSALNYVYFLGFLSLGVTFVIATGGIDFSIGPVMFCCALIAGYSLTSYGVPMALAMGIKIGRASCRERV